MLPGYFQRFGLCLALGLFPALVTPHHCPAQTPEAAPAAEDDASAKREPEPAAPAAKPAPRKPAFLEEPGARPSTEPPLFGPSDPDAIVLPTESKPPFAQAPTESTPPTTPEGASKPAKSEPAEPPPPTRPAASPPAGQSAPWPEGPVAELSVEQLRAELHAVEQRLKMAQAEVTPEKAAELGVTEEDLKKRVATLQDLENVIHRRLTSRNRRDEATQALASLEKQISDFEATGLEGDPPYELMRLDSLKDELMTADRERESERLSMQSMEESLARARQQVAAAERRRRELRESLEGGGAAPAAEGAKPSEASRFRLGVAELAERAAQHELAQAEAKLHIAKQSVRVKERRREALQARVAALEPLATLTQDELSERLAELDARRDELEAQLRSLRQNDQVNQMRLEDARESLTRVRGEEEIRKQSQTLAAREAWAQASSRGVELLQERINDVAKAKAMWQRRHELSNQPTEEQLADWDAETDEALAAIQQRREEVEQRLGALRTARLDLANRLAEWNASMGDKAGVEQRLAAIEARQQHENDYLATLMQLERLTERVAAEIDQARELDSWAKYWSRLIYLTKESWRREVFALDDRPFRVGDLAWAVIVFLVVLIVAWVVRLIMRRTLLRQLKERATSDKAMNIRTLLAVIGHTRREFVVLLAAYLGLTTLPLSVSLGGVVRSLAIVIVTMQMALWASAALGGWIETTKKRQAERDPSAASAFGLMAFFSKVAIWSAALLLALTNLGYEIGPLLAGLGVGGVAVAFALQSILGDIFCSIAIVLDKPFLVGDFIIVDDMLGSVEHIGIKTTRIRSLSGEQIIFSNADLIGSRIRNFKRMFERRILFAVGVVYETPADKLEKIPEIIRKAIQGIEQTRFDRAHFKNFGDFSLNFETVYYVFGPDYNLYMEIQQKINLAILRAFAEEGISFAYPTRELIIRPPLTVVGHQ